MSETKCKEPLTAVVIGCGERGFNAYGRYALENPKKLKFVGCADVNTKKCELFAKLHKISPESVFATDMDLLNAGKLADAIFITTMDQFHEQEVFPALDLGYHVFLEKPMTITEEGCRKIVKRSEEVGKVLAVGHVLRYSPLFSKVKEIIDSGAIGDIINIKHSENMATWVYAHSFVRGNWENSLKTSSLILQKGCHDLDLIYWFAGSIPVAVSAFAMPTPFCEANAPENAPERCIDGCPYETTCLYETKRFYLQGKFVMEDNTRSENPFVRWVFHMALKHPRFIRNLVPQLRKLNLVPWRVWPTDQLSEDLSDEGIMKALREGPYGRCIYRCNNDQPVSQVTNIQFENGITATYTLHGMSYRDGRELRVDGTKGTIKAYFYNTGFYVDLYEHSPIYHRRWKLKLETTAGGGGDFRIVDGFINAINGISPPLTTARESLYSHLMAFAAEKSIKNGQVEKFIV